MTSTANIASNATSTATSVQTSQSSPSPSSVVSYAQMVTKTFTFSNLPPPFDVKTAVMYPQTGKTLYIYCYAPDAQTDASCPTCSQTQH